LQQTQAQAKTQSEQIEAQTQAQLQQVQAQAKIQSEQIEAQVQAQLQQTQAKAQADMIQSKAQLEQTHVQLLLSEVELELARERTKQYSYAAVSFTAVAVFWAASHAGGKQRGRVNNALFLMHDTFRRIRRLPELIDELWFAALR
jgi:hypothetical protein